MGALFDWNEVFVTGIGSVDDQHQRLVNLINELAAIAFEGAAGRDAELMAARDALLDYTRVHFSDEEQMMEQAGLDPRFVDMHKAQHQAFVDEVASLGPVDHGESLDASLSYLMGWLAHHILGVDQSMARQLRGVASGVVAAQAFDAEATYRRSAGNPLLDALNVMLHVVSQRNRELRRANLELEQRVLERTSDLTRLNDQLQLLAVHDDLTRLPNRRFAISALQELWAEAGRDGRALSVLMIDVDKFKRVNDTWGHAEGDRLLRALATQLRHAVRTSDIVCRLGGDEFLVMCPGSDLQGARRVAAKLLSEVSPYRDAAGQELWDGSLSIGAAQLGDGMASPEDLLAAADRALYDAKGKGGHRQA